MKKDATLERPLCKIDGCKRGVKSKNAGHWDTVCIAHFLQRRGKTKD